MKRSVLLLGVLGLVAAAILAVTRLREAATVSDTSFASAASLASSQSAAPAARYPHARHDPAKRDEMRARLLAAVAETSAKKPDESTKPAAVKHAAPAEGAAAPGDARGNRESNDLKEFGRFVQQAIKDDFLPMARGCAAELRSRDPKARGSATIAFKLIGDKKIGGVVDEADVDAKKSTLHDEKFETCVRESLYGVYFDPPPADAVATLNFPITLLDDGGIADDVDDFDHIRDRRNEK